MLNQRFFESTNEIAEYQVELMVAAREMKVLRCESKKLSEEET